MSLSTLRRVKVKTFHGATNREKRSEVVSPGFGDTKWKFYGAAEEYAEAMTIIYIVGMRHQKSRDRIKR